MSHAYAHPSPPYAQSPGAWALPPPQHLPPVYAAPVPRAGVYAGAPPHVGIPVHTVHVVRHVDQYGNEIVPAAPLTEGQQNAQMCCGIVCVIVGVSLLVIGFNM